MSVRSGRRVAEALRECRPRGAGARRRCGAPARRSPPTRRTSSSRCCTARRVRTAPCATSSSCSASLMSGHAPRPVVGRSTSPWPKATRRCRRGGRSAGRRAAARDLPRAGGGGRPRRSGLEARSCPSWSNPHAEGQPWVPRSWTGSRTCPPPWSRPSPTPTPPSSRARIAGVEVAVSIVDLGDGPMALPAVEVVPDGGFYDYAARYTAGATEFFAPARLDRATWPNAARRPRSCAHTPSGCATSPAPTSSSTPRGPRGSSRRTRPRA